MKQGESKVWQRTLLVVAVVIVLCAGVLWYALQRIHASDPQSYSKTNELIVDDFTSYTSLHDYTDKSDIVALGNVMDDGKVRAGNRDDPTNIHTDYRIQLTYAPKGKSVAPWVTLTLMGGVHNDTFYTYENRPQLKKGDKVAIFATRGDDERLYPLNGGTAVVKQRPDGNYRIDGITFTPKDLGIE